MLPIHIILITAFVGATALAAGLMFMFAGAKASPVEGRLDVLTGRRASHPTAEHNVGQLLADMKDMANPAADFLRRFGGVQQLIDQSGLKLPPSMFLGITGATAAAGGVFGVAAGLPVYVAPLAALMTATLPLGYVWFKRGRRLKAFGKQLPEALELIARALRAGHSLASGISLVADEMNDPIRSEFSRAHEEQNLGVPIEESLEDMTLRVPNLDLRFFVTAIILQRQTGGDLAEILDKIGRLIRERFKIYGQIQALTGEGRLSGIVLLALPPVLFVVMYKLNPDYTMMLFNDPLGQQMLIFAIISQFVGAMVIRKIIQIKV